MVVKFDNAILFSRSAYWGLSEYRDNRIEFLTLSRSHQDPTDIKIYFNKFIEMISHHRWGIMKIQYCLVCVDNQHIHALIKKPFHPIQKMREYWQTASNAESHILIRTVSGDKSDPSKMMKTVSYMAEQAFKHNLPVEFFRTDEWGIYGVKKKKKEKEIQQDLTGDAKSPYVKAKGETWKKSMSGKETLRKERKKLMDKES